MNNSTRRVITFSDISKIVKKTPLRSSCQLSMLKKCGKSGPLEFHITFEFSKQLKASQKQSAVRCVHFGNFGTLKK